MLLNQQNQPYSPFSTQVPKLKAYTHPVKPSPLWGAYQSKSPLPTNAWWESLGISNGNGDGVERIAAYPYTYHLLSNQIVVNVPPLEVLVPDQSIGQSGTMYGPDFMSMKIGAVEALTNHQLQSFDFLSSNWAYQANGGSINVGIVRGAPYVTLEFDQLTPQITCDESAFLSVNGSTQPGKVGPDTRFVIEKSNGQTWVLYTSSPVAVTWGPEQPPSPEWKFAFDEKFSGTVRLALVKAKQLPPPTAPNYWYGSVDNDIAVLDAHKDVIPTGADVQAYVSGSKTTLIFHWKTKGAGDLLMMGLPHHFKVMQNPQKTANVNFPAPCGLMTGVAGNSWTMEYEAPNIGFVAPRPINDSLKSKIAAALPADIAAQKTVCNGTVDPYAFGQSMAGIAYMGLVANEVNDASSAKEALDFCKSVLETWLTGDNWKNSENSFVYDTTWGGIVSKNGIENPAKDYGNGYYNDHHFHYGYFIYTAAVIGKTDPEWVNQHQEAILGLVRDIANPSDQDPSFTSLRHTDFFRGHSWANGLFALGDGRNQESTSEAVNAWYAISLLGQVLNNPEIENIGKMLLSMEIVSAQEYWQIPNSNKNYPSDLARLGVGVNQWSTKIDFFSFFGTEAEYSFGIEALPFTPIAEALINPEWPKDHWPMIQQRLDGGVDPQWVEYMYMLQATFAPSDAVQNMNTKPPAQYHTGTSESLTWYFLATRP